VREKSREIENKLKKVWREINLREDYYKALKKTKVDMKKSGEWN